jgi:hypothetical protein
MLHYTRYGIIRNVVWRFRNLMHRSSDAPLKNRKRAVVRETVAETRTRDCDGSCVIWTGGAEFTTEYKFCNCR